MKRTKDGLDILRKRIAKSARLQTLVEEERANHQAALALRAARKKAGLTQVQLAKEAGTTQSVIARLEDANYKGHTLRILEHIAEALDRRVEIRLLPATEQGSYGLHAP
jgi:ribosome-binding protein aMBF1 (putative translation factor)